MKAKVVCRFCGREIEFQEVPGGGRVAVERLADGGFGDHVPLCAGKEKRTAAYAKAKSEAKAEGFHGAALDKEVRRRVYEAGADTT